MLALRTPLLALLTATLIAGCGTTVVNPVTGQAERTVMDEAAEVKAGQQAHQQVLQEYGRYHNDALQRYVDGIGQKLAAQSHRAHLTWTFTVLDSPEINAFALPGGYVYVTRGIMAYMDSEAELAGVLGHEIGHVTARHGAQRATRQQNAGLGVLAATVLGAVLESQGMRGATDVASQMSQTAAAGFIASYSREQELQADELGAEYLARSQYDPSNMVDVIRLLKNQERFAADVARAEGRPAPSGANWLASHPSNEQRLAHILAVADAYKGQYTDDGRARYLKAIDGMSFGDSPSQGLVRGSQFLHPVLNLAWTAPKGWRIVNASDSVTLVNPTGDAGLVMQLAPQKAGSDHDSLIRQVLKPVDGRVERRQINGLAATHFNGTVRTAQGQPVGVRMTVVSGPEGRTYLLRYAARQAQALQAALPQLQAAEASFRAMTAADRQAARPWTLRTVPYPKGGFAELARRSPLDTQSENHLKLINSLYQADRQPAVGQMVKTVQ
jgi:predicted Zn-dependent protease